MTFQKLFEQNCEKEQPKSQKHEKDVGANILSRNQLVKLAQN